MCKFDAEIMTGQRSEFIASIIYHVRTTANVVAMCAIVTMMAGDMRTLLDWNNFSFSSNGQVVAHRVTGLISKGFGDTKLCSALSFVRIATICIAYRPEASRGAI